MQTETKIIELDYFAQEVARMTRLLVRENRLRDRDEVICYGVTTLQWETMDAIGQVGEATMNEISAAMSLANSTMTRVVDQLVEKKLVERRPQPRDRRVVRVALTPAGQERLALVRQCMLDTHRAVLEHIQAEHRQTVLWALTQLWEARKAWSAKADCCPT